MGEMLKGTGSWEWSPYSTGVEWSPVTAMKVESALLLDAEWMRLMSWPSIRSVALRKPTCNDRDARDHYPDGNYELQREILYQHVPRILILVAWKSLCIPTQLC